MATLRTLEEIAREGARQMLQAALEAEVEEHLARHRHLVHEDGRRMGWCETAASRRARSPVASAPSPYGDRGWMTGRWRASARNGFPAASSPKFMRRAPRIDALVPVLYRKGISTDDFPAALEAILGPAAKGLSAATVVRLKEIWTQEYSEWCRRDLSAKRYGYVWADGGYSPSPAGGRAVLPAGGDRRRFVRQQGVTGRRGRLSGEHAILAGAAAGPALPRPPAGPGPGRL